jgi:hypothetical protein
MDVETRLADLLRRFRDLCPEAATDLGPLDRDARLELRDVLNAWLDHYPFLQNDAGYLAFLRRCSAACAFADERNVRIEVAGVLAFEEQLATFGFPTREDGWYCLGWSAVYLGAIGDLDNAIYHGYAFDATGTRPWGVYHRSGMSGRPRSDYRLMAASFLDFLDLLIASRGNPFPDAAD